MNILVLDTIYQSILKEIEAKIQTQHLEGFEAIRQEILSYRFGTSGCYEYYFSEYGHECIELVANSVLLQSAWSKEAKIGFLNTKAWDKSFYFSRTKAFHPFLNYLRQFHFLAVQQVKFYKPDVLIIKDIHEYPPKILKQFKESVSQLVGFCSSTIVDPSNFREYDLILSSVPANLDIATNLGVKNKRVFPAFDTRNLEFQSKNREISTSFIGSIYSGTIPILKAALEVDPELQIFAPNPEALQSEKGLLNNYVGNTWGLEMYKIYGKSKITLNRHGAIASNFAANMRLFEATGMGACLITENRPNLTDLFDPSTEVVPYEDLQDLQSKLKLVLESESRRQRIAEAGQRRCLQQHSYNARIKDILTALTN
jgi:spore maturation protein CgeB